jgi:hypothetical protein
MGGDMAGSPLRAFEWLLELAFTAMLPALISGPVIVGVLLILQAVTARMGMARAAIRGSRGGAVFREA